VLLGLALRIAFALLYWVNQPLTHDEREYLSLARSVARGEGFRYPADEPSPGTGQQIGRAPGYPVFLAALGVTMPSEHVPRRVQIAQASVGALGIWLIASIAGRAAGPRAAVTAAAIAAVYPPFVWMPSYALSETLYSTIALAAALALQEAGGWRLEAGKTRVPPASNLQPPASVVTGGLLVGFAILVRPAMVLFLPFAGLWFLWRRRALQGVVFVLVALLSVAPWTIRNHRVHGRWIFVASEGGVTFWTGNHPLARGDGDLAANEDLKRAELEFRGRHPNLTPEQLEPLYYRDALEWIRSDPARWLALLARKTFYTVVPLGPSYAVHSWRYRVASAASYVLVLIAAIAGAWRWRAALRSRSGQTGTACAPAALWLMAAATVAAGVVFFPQERFRVPVIDPALIVSASLLAAPRERR
jgi:4-amino-4-deoxy-L-arabinose transferase-like glycosyltransferase